MVCYHSANQSAAFTGSSPKLGRNAWRLKIGHERNGVFSSLFLEKNYSRIINLFRIFAFGVIKQLLYHQYGTIFLFYADKSSDYAEDVVTKVCGSALSHPVRCPEYT